MQLMLASLCDFAADYQGKLCLTGAFDSIWSRKFPAEHPQCSVAVRLMLNESDAGHHTLELQYIDPDGQPVSIGHQPPRIQFTVRQLPPQSFFLSQNIVCNFHRLPIPGPGMYEIRILIDSEIVAALPLQVIAMPEGGPLPPEGEQMPPGL